MVIARLALLVVAGTSLSQEPTYQGKTLREWLAHEPPPGTSVPGLPTCYSVDRVAAVATLGRASSARGDAFELLVAQWQRGRIDDVEQIAQLGREGLGWLRERRSSIPEERWQRAAVVSGAVDEVLAGARDPIAGSSWIRACQHADLEFAHALCRRLADGDRDRGVALLCLSRCPVVPAESCRLLIAALEERGEEQRSAAIAALTMVDEPRALRPLLERLGKPIELRAGYACLEVIRNTLPLWSFADFDCVPVLRAMLATRQYASTHAAALVAGRLGPRGAVLSEALAAVTAAREPWGVDTRTEALLAVWRIDPAGTTAATALDAALADRDRAKELAGAWLYRTPPSEHALPFLRRLLREGTDELRASVLRRLLDYGPLAKDLRDDVTALIPGPEAELASLALAAIAPEPWHELESRLVAAAKEELAAGSIGPATRALLLHDAPTATFLDLYEGFVRERAAEESRAGAACFLLRHGRPAAAIGELAAGRPAILRLPLNPNPFVPRTADTLTLLCRSRAALAPGVPWLRGQLADLEEFARCKETSDRGATCVRNPPETDRPVWARLLGASGAEQIPFLRPMLQSERELVRRCGFAGLGEMARDVTAARDVLVDFLVKNTDAAVPTAQVANAANDPWTPFVDGVARGGPGTATSLARLLRTETPRRTTIALRTLERMARDAAGELAVIETFLDAQDVELRSCSLAAALACAEACPLDDAALAPALARLRDEVSPSPALQVLVLRLLPRNAKALLEALRDAQPLVKAWLLDALGPPSMATILQASLSGRLSQLPRRRVERLDPLLLLPFVADVDANVRLAAMRALKNLPPHDECTRRLLELGLTARDWQVRALVLMHVPAGNVPPEGAFARLREAPEEPDLYVREIRRNLLRQWRGAELQRRL